MSEGLKPCPFCGSETVCAALLDIPYDPRRCYVLCQQCGARGPVFNGHEKVAVVEAAWNSRAVPAPDQSDRERAIQFAKGTFGEDAKIEDSPFVDRLAAEFAKVREEQKEMDAKIADGMIDRNDAGKIDHDDIGSITALDIRDAIRRGEP